jgi:hypothetical protein
MTDAKTLESALAAAKVENQALTDQLCQARADLRRLGIADQNRTLVSDINRLADLVGDFDLLSDTGTALWKGIEWRAIADALGFSQLFGQALEAGRTVTSAGLEGFSQLMERRPATLTEAHARAQSTILVELGRIGRERGDLWRIQVDPTEVLGGACYDAGATKLRAFEADPSPGYFGDGLPGPRPRAESECGWGTPLVLHLGTFPWIYSSRLGDVGPGARWSSSTSQPAIEGLHVVASLMEPATNLRQDARQVAAIYRHFATQTAPLVARLPAFQAGRASAGQLDQRGRFLHAHQGSLHVVALDGPRGRLAASAYNYILRRFASFFAVRRATLRALMTLPLEVQRQAASSADPCLRQHIEGVARAS